MNGTSVVYDMEMTRLDQEIEKTRKQFYTTLLGKKRRVKRKWLEISAMTNAHLLQTLPYRAMLGHVAKLAEERDKIISEMGTCDDSTQESNNGKENCSREVQNDDNNDSKSTCLPCPSREIIEEKECCRHSRSNSRDEAIQTEESSFSSQS